MRLADLVHASVVLAHGVGHAGRVVAALHRAPVGRALVVGLHVLAQVVLVLEAEVEAQREVGPFIYFFERKQENAKTSET